MRVGGCTAEESCEVRQCDSATDDMVANEGLPLTVDTKDIMLNMEQFWQPCTANRMATVKKRCKFSKWCVLLSRRIPLLGCGG
jgi:hypothetical protein